MVALFKLEEQTKKDFTQWSHFRVPVNDFCVEKFPQWVHKYLNHEASSRINHSTGQLEFCQYSLNVLLVDSVSRFDGLPNLSKPFNGKYGEFIFDQEGIDQMIQEVSIPKILVKGKTILTPMKKLMGLVDRFVYKEHVFFITNV